MPVLVVLVLCVPLALSAQSQALIEKSRHGKELMAAGKFEQAIPVYRQLSRAIPDNPGLLLNLGMALQMAGHSREAIRPLQSAVKLDAGIPPAWMFLGAAYLGAGRPTEAIGPLGRYAGLQPEDPKAHELLGDALLAAGRSGQAAAEYRRLSELDATNPRGWYGLNRSCAAEARRAFQSVEKAAPESALWLALVADERMVRRQFQSAFFFYRKAEALQPDLAGLHSSIAEVYRETGHADWAEAELRKETELNCAVQPLACHFAARRYDSVIRQAGPSASPEECYWRSRAFARMAREAFARLEQLPEGPEIHELRAELMRARRQHQEAVKQWRLALRYAPEDIRLREELLSSLYQARDYPAALALAGELLRKDPASPQLNFTQGDILLGAQETEKAIPYLKSALKLDPGMVAAHHALGRAYMLAGKPVEAIPHLRSALSIDEDGSLRYQLSKAYQAAGQTELARKTLEEYQGRMKAGREEKSRIEKELRITPP